MIAIRAEVGRGLESSFAPEKRIRDSIRPKVDVNAIRMNLNASDERPKQVGGFAFVIRCNDPDDLRGGGERAFDVGRAAASRRQRLRDGVGIGEEGFEAGDDEDLELARWQALPLFDPAGRSVVRDQPARDIVAISHALLHRMGRRHRFALGVEENAGEQIGQLCPVARACPLDAVGFEFLLNLPPEVLVDDGRMFTGIGGALVDDLAADRPGSAASRKARRERRIGRHRPRRPRPCDAC